MNIAPLAPADRAAWQRLAEDYKRFYETVLPATDYDTAWSRLLAQDGVLGLGARVDGQLVGIAHYLLHTSTWASQVCYLQDLFVAPAARGQGVARALIEAVARAARAHNASRFYWITEQSNTAARALYDQVARYNGFIRYDHPLGRA
jgi:GNAT superfamily N-acetyltransferase